MAVLHVSLKLRHPYLPNKLQPELQPGCCIWVGAHVTGVPASSEGVSAHHMLQHQPECILVTMTNTVHVLLCSALFRHPWDHDKHIQCSVVPFADRPEAELMPGLGIKIREHVTGIPADSEGVSAYHMLPCQLQCS